MLENFEIIVVVEDVDNNCNQAVERCGMRNARADL